MKKILNYIPVLGLALGLCACESDLETTTFNAATAKAAVLSELDAAYVLDAQKSEETVFTLQWTEPDMGYQAATTNYVQMALAGNDFTNATIIASVGKGGQLALTHNSLNNSILSLLEKNGMDIAAADFEFRIASAISVAADTIYSNVIATNITPFVGERQYPSIALRGDYNGWDFNNSQKVYSANEDNNYAGMIYFDGKAQNGWKFCGTEDWSVDNWGVGDGATAEQTPIILANNGSDIKIYSHNSYYFEFNNSTGELKVTWAYDSWGIVGNHNGWGSGDTKMTLASEVDNAGVTQYFLTATMDMEAGNTWKIRPDEKWENDRGPGSVELEGDAADNGDGNFRVDAAGNYTFKWYFNKVTQRLVVTKN